MINNDLARKEPGAFRQRLRISATSITSLTSHILRERAESSRGWPANAAKLRIRIADLKRTQWRRVARRATKGG